MFELNTRIHQVHFQPVPIGVLLQLQLFVHWLIPIITCYMDFGLFKKIGVGGLTSHLELLSS